VTFRDAANRVHAPSVAGGDRGLAAPASAVLALRTSDRAIWRLEVARDWEGEARDREGEARDREGEAPAEPVRAAGIRLGGSLALPGNTKPHPAPPDRRLAAARGPASSAAIVVISLREMYASRGA
jgi:hypothetical protein